MTLYELLAHTTAPRVIVLESFDVLWNGKPREILNICGRDEAKFIDVLNIDICYSNGCILIVEVFRNGIT